MLHPGPHTGHFELKWVGPVKLQMCKITEEFLVVRCFHKFTENIFFRL